MRRGRNTGLNVVRATVDSNIWVSAVISSRGAPARLEAGFRRGRFALITSQPLLDEIEGVLRRPRLAARYKVTPEKVAAVMELLRNRAEIVAISGTIHVCRDPDDDAVIDDIQCWADGPGAIGQFVKGGLRHGHEDRARARIEVPPNDGKHPAVRDVSEQPRRPDASPQVAHEFYVKQLFARVVAPSDFKDDETGLNLSRTNLDLDPREILQGDCP